MYLLLRLSLYLGAIAASGVYVYVNRDSIIDTPTLNHRLWEALVGAGALGDPPGGALTGDVGLPQSSAPDAGHLPLSILRVWEFLTSK